MLFLEVGAEQLPFQLRREPFDVSKIADDSSVGRIEDNEVSGIARLMPEN